MLLENAIALFGGEKLTIDASDRRFLITLVDPEFRVDDLLVRVEISFLEDLGELKPGNQGGRFTSIKSGRLSAGLLVDWGLVDQENGKAFVDFCRNWDAGRYYTKGGQSERCIITSGIISGQLTEFTGPTGATTAGLVRIKIDNGRMSVGASGASEAGKTFIANLLKTNPAPSTRVDELLF